MKLGVLHDVLSVYIKEKSMFPRSSALAISVIAMMSLPVAVAQLRGAAAVVMMGDDAGIVLGEPCAVVEKTVVVRPLADGTTITKRTEERKWRDSPGRFRKEVTQVVEGEQAVFHRATIIDPVSNTLTLLNLDRKVATVIHLPEQGPGKLHEYVELDDKTLMAMPGVQVKVEKLDGKPIAGVYAVGRRVTRTRPPGTIGNDKVITSVSERWVSQDLKILLASSMDDPREKQTREVTQLDRAEPDSSLFKVPSGFTVKEVPVDQSQR
jgi:hypothetical protein